MDLDGDWLTEATLFTDWMIGAGLGVDWLRGRLGVMLLTAGGEASFEEDVVWLD